MMLAPLVAGGAAEEGVPLPYIVGPEALPVTLTGGAGGLFAGATGGGLGGAGAGTGAAGGRGCADAARKFVSA